MTLKIAQLNTRGSEFVWHLLERIAQKWTLDIILIQEPPKSVTQGRHPWYGYRTFFPLGKNPLVTIMVRNSFRVKSHEFGCPRVFGISVNTTFGSMLCLNAYIQHTTGVGAKDLEKALSHEKKEFSFIILGMDSNGHSELWGPAKQGTNRVGMMVEDVLGGNDMVVVNDPESTETFRSDGGRVAWIDVTALSPQLLHSFARWTVAVDAEVGSDHHLLVTELTSTPMRGTVRIRHDWQSVDWSRFRAKLMTELGTRHALRETPETGDQLDAAVSEFIGSIHNTVATEVPQRRPCQWSKKWWTAEIGNLHSRLSHARRRWRRHNTEWDRVAFLRARRLFQGRIRTAK